MLVYEILYEDNRRLLTIHFWKSGNTHTHKIDTKKKKNQTIKNLHLKK